MSTTIKLRRGNATEWTDDNPVLHSGEPGFELDTGKLKIGDGVHAWTDLDYFPNIDDVVSGVASVDGRTGVVTLGDIYAALIHIHSMNDVTGLTSALSGKAATVHVHAETDVTNLVTDLAGKAPTSHAHAESDVTGLTADLAGKAATVHTHTESDVTGLTSDLAGKAATVHTHAESDITGLTSDLAGKAATVHTHAASDVTSGTFDIARIPTGTSHSTVSFGDHTHAGGSTDAPDRFSLSHYGFVAASGDPIDFIKESQFANDGAFYQRMWVPGGKPLAGLWVAVVTAGTWGGSTHGNRLGLYDDTGALIDTTADDDTLWNAVGWRGGALQLGTVASQSNGRFVYVGVFCRGTTNAPTFLFPTNTNPVYAVVQTGPSTTKRRCMYNGSTTSVPSSFDPTSHGSATGFIPLIGIT